MTKKRLEISKLVQCINLNCCFCRTRRHYETFCLMVQRWLIFSFYFGKLLSGLVLGFSLKFSCFTNLISSCVFPFRSSPSPTGSVPTWFPRPLLTNPQETIRNRNEENHQPEHGWSWQGLGEAFRFH